MDFQEYLHSAQILHDQAVEETLPLTKERCAVASILFSWIALEAFVNHMMEDFAAVAQGTFTLHEQAFLEEREVEFSTSGDTLGQFVLKNSRRYQRLGDKIAFLVAKFSPGTKIDKGDAFWQRFEKSKDIRDSLSHPRKATEPPISPADADTALGVSTDVIKFLAEKVWKKHLDI